MILPLTLFWTTRISGTPYVRKCTRVFVNSGAVSFLMWRGLHTNTIYAVLVSDPGRPGMEIPGVHVQSIRIFPRTRLEVLSVSSPTALLGRSRSISCQQMVHWLRGPQGKKMILKVSTASGIIQSLPRASQFSPRKSSELMCFLAPQLEGTQLKRLTTMAVSRTSVHGATGWSDCK